MIWPVIIQNLIGSLSPQEAFMLLQSDADLKRKRKHRHADLNARASPYMGIVRDWAVTHSQHPTEKGISRVEEEKQYLCVPEFRQKALFLNAGIYWPSEMVEEAINIKIERLKSNIVETMPFVPSGELTALLDQETRSWVDGFGNQVAPWSVCRNNPHYQKLRDVIRAAIDWYQRPSHGHLNAIKAHLPEDLCPQIFYAVLLQRWIWRTPFEQVLAGVGERDLSS